MKYPSDKYIKHLAESETGRAAALKKVSLRAPSGTGLRQKMVWFEGG